MTREEARRWVRDVPELFVFLEAPTGEWRLVLEPQWWPPVRVAAGVD